MSDDLAKKIRQFARTLPYKTAPYSKRNWGHPLHSLCSYQGKLKPALAHWLVEMFTEDGSTVLDPLGGVGTIPFAASLLGRVGISNDLSPLAHAVATGKVCAPTSGEVEAALTRLSRGMQLESVTSEDLNAATFGLNGSVADFYHEQTLNEVLRARRYFLQLDADSSDLFVKACVLHVLHGNRPYALSRTSHPITPFHPTGVATYKPLVEHARARAKLAFKNALPQRFRRGLSTLGSYLDLPALRLPKADSIITSPPFPGMRFDRPNWLRLWFCGWSAEDFHLTSMSFLERQQLLSLDVYRDFFEVSSELLRENGLLVLHLGGAETHEMVAHLTNLANARFEVREIVKEDVSSLEHHGVRDKGLTKTHEFIFATRRAQSKISSSGRMAKSLLTRA